MPKIDFAAVLPLLKDWAHLVCKDQPCDCGKRKCRLWVEFLPLLNDEQLAELGIEECVVDTDIVYWFGRDLHMRVGGKEMVFADAHISGFETSYEGDALVSEAVQVPKTSSANNNAQASERAQSWQCGSCKAMFTDMQCGETRATGGPRCPKCNSLDMIRNPLKMLQ